MRKELENLTESDEKVRQMLASLKQVEAPKDFEFRLKARLANASPKAYRTSYKRRFAYALPVSALAIISTFALINGNFSGGANQANPVAETTIQSGFNVPLQNPSVENIAANTIVNKEPEETFIADSNVQIRKDEKIKSPFVAVKASEKPKDAIRKEPAEENSGGSKVDASTQTEVRTPRGLNPNTKIEAPKDFSVEKDFSVQELLSPLGIEVVSENGKWKVKNVSRDSQAERLGVKTDDVIETFDGRKLSGAPLRGKRIEVKKLGVKRGGEQIEINLQTNPK